MDLATIQKRIAMLEKEENEIHKAKEMIKSELDNNAEYKQALEECKSANLKKKKIKESILSQTTYVQLQMDMKEATEEIKTLQDILSVELLQHYQKTNSDEVIDANGEPRKFKISVKVLPKKSEYNKDHEGRFEEGLK